MRKKLKDARDQGAVIRLHMLDDHIVQIPAIQRDMEILQKELSDRFIDGVEQDSLLVQQQVGVVGHAVWDGMLIFKTRDAAVIRTNKEEVFSDFSDVVHVLPSFLRS